MKKILLIIMLLLISVSADLIKTDPISVDLNGIKFAGLDNFFISSVNSENKEGVLQEKIDKKIELKLMANKIKLGMIRAYTDNIFLQKNEYVIHVSGQIYGEKNKTRGIYILLEIKKYIRFQNKSGDFVLYSSQTSGYGNYKNCEKMILDFLEEEMEKICYEYHKDNQE